MKPSVAGIEQKDKSGKGEVRLSQVSQQCMEVILNHTCVLRGLLRQDLPLNIKKIEVFVWKIK